MPLAAALIAASALSSCDEQQKGASMLGGPRGANEKGEVPAKRLPGKPLVIEKPHSDFVGSATDEMDAQGRRLFDGQGRRTGSGVPVQGGDGRRGGGSRRYTFVSANAPEGRTDLQTKAPPLPDSDDYRYDAGASDGSSQEGGQTLLGFAAFQVEQKFPTAAPIMSRFGWKAAPRRGRNSAHTPYRVTVHHTQGKQAMSEADTAKAVKGTQWYHMVGRGKEGKDNFDDIGYHFLIAGDGRVVEGRRAEYLGAHAGGANKGNIGVAMMGDFNKVKPTAAQTTSLTRLVTFLSIKYKKDPLAKGFLEPHNHYTNTDCPGKNMMAILESLRRTIDREHDQIVDGRETGTFTPIAVAPGVIKNA
jgi:N-acetylmuramoyl-L-alanine amidase